MSAALVVVDMLNTYDHPDGERCAERAVDVVPRISDLIERRRKDDGALIFVNDNYDMWTSDRGQLIDHALQRAPDRGLIEPLLPAEDETLILKSRHSIFYQTPLEYFLRQREIFELTLVGQVTEQCILYSALAAYVRHFAVSVVRDAVIAIEDDLGDAALRMMARNMRADIIDAPGNGST